MGQQFHPRHPIHPNIQYREPDGMLHQICEKSFRFGKALHFKPGRIEQAGKGFTDGCIVIDEANGR